MRLAHVGDEVWVGVFHACDAKAPLFDLAVHIWRQSNRDEGEVCRQLAAGDVAGLAVRWREGEPPSAPRSPGAAASGPRSPRSTAPSGSATASRPG